jgi:hypothetical protein
MQPSYDNDEEMVIIPKRVFYVHIRIEAYFAEFYRHVQDGKNHREAYEAVEADLSEYGFPPKYDSYENFRRGKSYHYNKDNPVKFW